MTKYLELAKQAARMAGRIQMRYYKVPVESIMMGYKTYSSSIVTKADKEVEEKTIAFLSARAPEVSFLGEESGASGFSKNPDALRWIIDPIDGTINFARKIPFFCYSIGLARGDDLLAGVVFNPASKEMFYAEKGKGAFLNGKKISVAPDAQKNEMVICTDWPHKPQSRDEIARLIGKYKNEFRFMPIFGSAALELCYVANGRFHGYLLPFMNPWDVAAGTLIVKEAGGKNFTMDGNEWALSKGGLFSTNGQFPL